MREAVPKNGGKIGREKVELNAHHKDERHIHSPLYHRQKIIYLPITVITSVRPATDRQTDTYLSLSSLVSDLPAVVFLTSPLSVSSKNVESIVSSGTKSSTLFG